MDEKIMEDLDPDFLSDILGPSELNDHLIDDLMNEIVNTNSQTTTTTSTQSQGSLINIANLNQHHVVNIHQNYAHQPQIHHTIHPELTIQHINATATTMMASPAIINQSYVDPTLQQQPQNDSFVVNYPATMTTTNQPMSANGPRRVRKNLKDILTGGEVQNTNTILLNQNVNFIESHHRMIGGGYQSPPTQFLQQQPQILPQINTVGNQIDVAATTNSNNQYFIDKNAIQINEKVFQLSPSSNIQIVIDPNPTTTTTTMATSTMSPVMNSHLISPSQQQLINPSEISTMSSTTLHTASTSSSPMRKVPSSSSIENGPSPSSSSQNIPSPTVTTTSTTSTTKIPKTSSSSIKKTTSKSSRNSLVKLEPDQLKASMALVGDENSMVVGKKLKPHKRTSHNAIERKYRSSINDKITELKNKVAGPNVKLQKSGILRKALEFIGNIEATNRKLVEENNMLRSALKTISMNSNNQSVIESVIRGVNYNTSTSPSSDTGSPCFFNTPSPSSSENTFSMSNTDSSNDSSPTSTPMASPQPSSVKRASTYTNKSSSNKKQASSDRSRVILCAILLSVLVFNPFGLIMSPPKQSSLDSFSYRQDQSVHGRVLNSFESASENRTLTSNESNSYSHLARSLIGWLLNILLVFVCLTFVYASGESSISINDKMRELLWLRYDRANKEWGRRNYEEAHGHLETGMKELGQQTAHSKLNLTLGIAWQLIRLALDRLYIGKWLTRFTTGASCPVSTRLTAIYYYEMHKFAYLNRRSRQDFIPKPTMASAALNDLFADDEFTRRPLPTYSFLAGLYYLLALYNQCERLDVDSGCEADLCEFYLAMALFARFYLPRFISRRIVRLVINEKLMVKLNLFASEDGEEEKNKLKKLFRKNLFVNFIVNFDVLTPSTCTSPSSNNSSLLIAYKRRLFSSPLLYDSDSKQFSSSSVSSIGGVSLEFMAAKFRDYILDEMTDHVISQSAAAVVDVNQLVSSGGREEVERELSDVDKAQFDMLRAIYTQDLEFIWSSSSRHSHRERRVERETQHVLIEFLEMLNEWKLAEPSGVRRSLHVRATNAKNSLFIQAVLTIIAAYEQLIIDKKPVDAVVLIKKASECISMFEAKSNPVNVILIEKFEVLIYDWILSAQTYIWTHYKYHELSLFNKSLVRFKTLVANYPQLSYKAKMYETVMMFSSNRNPINLLHPTSNQLLYSKSNQDAFHSMSSILKKFQLLQLQPFE